MHLHFERTLNAKSDCPILSLTWMGKVPDELPEDDGWKLNRTNYYQEGWLATGNIRGIVGVTFTTSHCKRNVEYPLRTNYNLRGHRSEVILVKWNEPYQKLASCDSSGIIFVWIKYEGRWSIELINDRNTPVTHFSWSHDGRMALICYQDGFVLVGSVAGQRYWSSMLNLDATITCGIWTPDDQQVYFGTTSGQIIVMDVHGAMVCQVQLVSEISITSMAWSCEKFKMEEGNDNDPGVTNAGERKFVLAVCLQNGFIYLLSNFDDVSPIQINTYLQGPLCMEWSNSREFLAVTGVTIRTSPNGPQLEYTNVLKFYNEKGMLLYSTVIPETQTRVSTLTWGHNDKRIFIATGTQIHIAWISKRIASLQLLCRLRIHNLISTETQLCLLPLPMRLRNMIGNFFVQTIRCCIPEQSCLRDFVSKPPMGSVRLHCTMIRHDDDTNLSAGTCYSLYLEYLGGLVPLLKGKRTSKIRPEFVIFDPQENEFSNVQDLKSSSSSSNSAVENGLSDSSDTDREEGCTGSPRLPRRRKRRSKRILNQEKGYYKLETDAELDALSYVDSLPEQNRLVEVTSNIWGTKFKMHGLAASVPANLGQVTYKTSLLHLQPRQMTLVMTELGEDFPVSPDPNFNPNIFSEDEDENPAVDLKTKYSKLPLDNSPPIAPIIPRSNILSKQNNFYMRESKPCSSIGTINLNEENHLTNLSENSTCIDIRPHTSPGTFCTQCTIRPNSSQNSYIGYFKNATGCTSSIQRQAISPMSCEASVPPLQSPKNAVAPSDIIFDRAPTSTIISYSTSEYFNSLGYSKLSNETTVNVNLNNEIHKSILLKKADNNIVQDHEKKMCNKSANKEVYCADEDNQNNILSCSNHSKMSSTFFIDSMVRSCSVGYLDMVEAQLVPSDALLLQLRTDSPKRLILVNKKQKTKRQSRFSTRQLQENEIKNSKLNPVLKKCGKSRSLDSSDIFVNKKTSQANNFCTEKDKDQELSKSINPHPCNVYQKEVSKKKVSNKISLFTSPLMKRKNGNNISREFNQPNKTDQNGVTIQSQALMNLEKLITKLKDDTSRFASPVRFSPHLPRSSPASPSPNKKDIRPQSASPIRRRLMNSPLLGRRYRKNKNQESSDDELIPSGDELNYSTNYKDLETFQKSQLRQKLKRAKIEPNGNANNIPFIPQRREFVMHNKAPMWNESSQVYQLDFGGRVTQESAKNFQIEFRGKQVMQFGRIDGNAYTLDFQYPFSALQAFAVALANVTQRLK